MCLHCSIDWGYNVQWGAGPLEIVECIFRGHEDVRWKIKLFQIVTIAVEKTDNQIGIESNRKGGSPTLKRVVGKATLKR